MTVLEEFFDNLWRQYCLITPQAAAIHRLFTETDGRVVNDHVAFRTFADSPIAIQHLEPAILSLGYQRYEPYDFPEKKLNAWSYLPPEEDQPRIFISELRWRECAGDVPAILHHLISQIPADVAIKPELFWQGRLWTTPKILEYEVLSAHSEYAAWLAIWGLRANHFTVSVNHLQSNHGLEQVIQLLQQHNYPLNSAGGLIKGSPQARLEQASTMADQVLYEFLDGQGMVPGCYYEFARRYADTSGCVYQGFVASSADKIFESTYRQ